MKKRGAMLHPNSGAGHVKYDGHDDDYLYECKDANGKTFRLVGKDLRASFAMAAMQGRMACWLVNFGALGFTAEVKLVPNGTNMEMMYEDHS